MMTVNEIIRPHYRTPSSPLQLQPQQSSSPSSYSYYHNNTSSPPLQLPSFVVVVVLFVCLSSLALTHHKTDAVITTERFSAIDPEVYYFDQFLDVARKMRSVSVCAGMCRLHADCLGFYFNMEKGVCRIANRLKKRSPDTVAPLTAKMFKKASYIIPTCPTALDYREYMHTAGMVCLKVFAKKSKYRDAKQACDRDGAFLAYGHGLVDAKILLDDAIADFGHGIHTYWVGVRKNEDTGIWRWDRGGLPPVAREIWRPLGLLVEHGHSHAHDCVSYRSETLEFVALNCADKKRYICEFDPI